MPVQLRRPSRYLDPGVPDHERALARRGTTLVGTVKSGALVDVVRHGAWFDEAMGAARAFARRAIARRGRPLEPGVGRHRRGDRHRRPRRARRRRAAAAAGSGDLPCDRDLRRQHRDPRGPAHRRVPAGRRARPDRDARVDRRADRLRAAGRQRRVGRSRDADGGRVLRRTRVRSAEPAAERPRGGCRDARRRRSALDRRARVPPHLRRHAGHPHDRAGDDDVERRARRARREKGFLCDLRGLGVDCRDQSAGGGDVRGVGGGRGRAVPGRRARVFARDVRGARR